MNLQPFAFVTTPRHVRDRRRWPRIDVAGRLRATIGASGVVVPLLDVSFGGCLIASRTGFVVGSPQELTLHTRDGAVKVTLAARVVHSRRDEKANLHVSGMRFIGPRTRDAAAEFDRLMDVVTSVLTFV